MPRSLRPFWPAFAAAALAFLAWTPTLSNGFAKDDFSNFAANPVMRRPELWPRLFFDKRAATVDRELANVYRPAASLSYALLTAGVGDNPYFFHLLGVAAHAGCVALVLLIGRELSGSWPAAAAGAAVFALHPAQAEGVSYASAAIPGTLSALLSLLALRAYAAGRRGRSLALFAAAVLFKESALALPLALAAHDRCVARRPARDIARRAAPFFAAAAALFLLRAAVLGASTDAGFHGGTLGGQAAFAFSGFWAHARSAFWPFGQRDCYSLDAWPRPLLGAAAAGAALAALAAGLARRAPWGFALAFAAAGLLPVCNLLPVSTLAADRYLYVPLAGLCWALACGLASRRRAALACATAALALVPRCLEQQRAWRCDFTADLAAAEAEPRDACGPALLAVVYHNWGDDARARRELDRASDRDPAPSLRRFLASVRAVVERSAPRSSRR